MAYPGAEAFPPGSSPFGNEGGFGSPYTPGGIGYGAAPRGFVPPMAPREALAPESELPTVPPLDELYPMPDLADASPTVAAAAERPHEFLMGPMQAQFADAIAEYGPYREGVGDRNPLTGDHQAYLSWSGLSAEGVHALSEAAAELSAASHVALETTVTALARTAHATVEQKALAQLEPQIEQRIAQGRRVGAITDDQAEELRGRAANMAALEGARAGAQITSRSPEAYREAIGTEEARITDRYTDQFFRDNAPVVSKVLLPRDIKRGGEGLAAALRRAETRHVTHPDVTGTPVMDLPGHEIPDHMPSAAEVGDEYAQLKRLYETYRAGLLEAVYTPVLERRLAAHNSTHGPVAPRPTTPEPDVTPATAPTPGHPPIPVEVSTPTDTVPPAPKPGVVEEGDELPSDAERLRHEGITYAKVAHEVLGTDGPIDGDALAERLNLTPEAVQAALARMEREGLLNEHNDEHNVAPTTPEADRGPLSDREWALLARMPEDGVAEERSVVRMVAVRERREGRAEADYETVRDEVAAAAQQLAEQGLVKVTSGENTMGGSDFVTRSEAATDRMIAELEAHITPFKNLEHLVCRTLQEEGSDGLDGMLRALRSDTLLIQRLRRVEEAINSLMSHGYVQVGEHGYEMTRLGVAAWDIDEPARDEPLNENWTFPDTDALLAAVRRHPGMNSTELIHMLAGDDTARAKQYTKELLQAIEQERIRIRPNSNPDTAGFSVELTDEGERLARRAEPQQEAPRQTPEEALLARLPADGALVEDADRFIQELADAGVGTVEELRETLGDLDARGLTETRYNVNGDGSSSLTTRRAPEVAVDELTYAAAEAVLFGQDENTSDAGREPLYYDNGSISSYALASRLDITLPQARAILERMGREGKLSRRTGEPDVPPTQTT